MMDELTKISEGLEQVFAHRESFIVVALTGRTGSGCSTVSDLLVAKTFDDLSFPELPFPSKSHEDRKDRIIKDWCASHWRPFLKIQVSHLILLLAAAEEGGAKLSRWLSFRFEDESASNSLRSLLSLIEVNASMCQKTFFALSNIRSSGESVVSEAVGYIFRQLPSFYSSVKDALDGLPEKSATRIFQEFGDNLRRSGSALDDEIRPDKLFSLPEAISRVIKLVRLHNKTVGDESRNYFVIDAIRHQYEARYLRERISPFYLVAVTTSEENRKSRLSGLNLRREEIDLLDQKEYPSEAKVKPSGYSRFVSQDIQACLDHADIYISNLGDSANQDLTNTTRLICRYVALMQHPGLITPTGVERCMQIAFAAKSNSGCISRQVGAAVTDGSGSIKGVGWNDVPKGQVPCLFRNAKHALSGKIKDGTYSDFELNDDAFKKFLIRGVEKFPAENQGGRNVSYCFKSIYNKIKGDGNQVHTRALHAEENAFLQVSKYGGSGLQGGDLYTTASPCELCAKKAFQIGIKNIYYIDPYPGISSGHVLGSGNAELRPSLHLFGGAIGRAYHELFDPIMPYKDELDKLVPSSSPARLEQSGDLFG